MNTKIDQKKYLQKYLNPKKNKKKNQKNKDNSSKRVNIIDDDIDVSQIMPIGDSEIDIYTTGEDAPQIAGIIDDRPIDVQLKEKFKFNTQWKLINEDDGFNSQLIVKEQKHEIKNSCVSDESKPQPSTCDSQNYSPKSKNNFSDNEHITIRKFNLKKSKAKISNKSSDSDVSPPRNKSISSKRKSDISSPRRKENKCHSDFDASPPRKKQTYDSCKKSKFNDTSKQQIDSDTSPPQKNSYKINKSKQDSDTSPPRKKRTEQDSDSIKSPSRKRSKKSSRWSHHDSDVNSPRKVNSNKNIRSDFDTSPPRKSNRQADYNLEKSNRNFRELNSSKNSKIEKKRNQRYNSDSDTSPSRIRKNNSKQRSDSSPKNLNVVKFNIRNPDLAEKRLEVEKRKIQEEKYATWGKGLKQVEERREKMYNDSHEMSKPLTRYADDEDLENFLKGQEREGDPMLEYIRKQNKTEKQDDTCSKPKYEGAFMPNRFGITPGYRWDGVDRSNGYEANWFNVQNSKKIFEEEAYKWSTDDM